MVVCLERGADLYYGPADATATHCHFGKIQISFTFLVPAHPGSPGKGPLNGCVCYPSICTYACMCMCGWRHFPTGLLSTFSSHLIVAFFSDYQTIYGSLTQRKLRSSLVVLCVPVDPEDICQQKGRPFLSRSCDV